jgi:16S rRNA processing protein RimM
VSITIDKSKSPQGLLTAVKNSASAFPVTLQRQLSEGVPQDLVTIARIARARGLKGEVLAVIISDFPQRFAELSRVFLRPSPSSEILYIAQLEDSWFHKEYVVLKFQTIDTRNQAEELQGYLVQIPIVELVPLPAGSYYEFQLVGCEVVDAGGKTVGRVKEMMHTGAAPLLVVSTDQGNEHLIPLAEEICSQIDIAAKKITITPPAGLLEL